MIEMAMGEEERGQLVVTRLEVGDSRRDSFLDKLWIGEVQVFSELQWPTITINKRKAEIEEDASSGSCDFNTTAADLLGAAMDGQSHLA